MCTKILRQPLHRGPFVRAPFMQEKTPHHNDRPDGTSLTNTISQEAAKPFRSNLKLWLAGDHQASAFATCVDASRCLLAAGRRGHSRLTSRCRCQRQAAGSARLRRLHDMGQLSHHGANDVSNRQQPGLRQRPVHLIGCSAATNADRRPVRRDGAA